MDLYEYQARDLFEAHGVPVLRGLVARTPAEARAAAEELGGGVVVVKAQVKVGGRGKAGGVKLAKSPEEAEQHARAILGMDIKGHLVEAVMVAEGADIAEEYYFSVLLDRANRNYLAMCSLEGGVEIEQLAEERPEALVRLNLDPRTGLDEAAAAQIVEQVGFAEDIAGQVTEVLTRLGDVYREADATLVEVNPLVKTGAGLVMSTLDVVAYAGEDLPGSPKPANFLDIGGGASAQVMADGLDIILSDPQVEVVFVNVFGGITACSEVAKGIRGALQQLGNRASKPIVVRLDGNAVEVGRAMLEEYNHPLVTVVETMDEAAAKAAELASAAMGGN